jgi:RND superfamily putative drug exporter
VLAVWLLLVAVVGGLGAGFGGSYTTEFSVPGIESQRAQDLLRADFPQAAAGVARVVFAAPKGSTLDAPTDRAAIDRGLRAAAKVPGVVAVRPPAQGGGVSPDHTVAYADVQFRQIPDDVPKSAQDALQASMAPVRQAGLTVEFGGTAMHPATHVGGPSEIVGVAIAFVVLALALGSLLAAGLPLVTALVGVAIGVLGVGFTARFVTMTDTATVLALMLGLAVGIDYALFIVSRHREQLADPRAEVADSIARATATAGSSVVFAGGTVVVALAALTATGIPFLSTMGLAAAATVLIAVLVALTLLPALLGWAGERLRPKQARQARAARAAGAHGTGGTAAQNDTAQPPAASAAGPGRGRIGGGGPGRWGAAWARAVTRRPVAVVLLAVVGLGVLAAPALHLRLGLPSNETQPAASTQHRSYDLLTRGFGPGFNAALTVAVDTSKMPRQQRSAAVSDLAAALRHDPDVAAVTPPLANPAGTLGALNVVPRSGPDDQATADLVHRIRHSAADGKQQVEKAGGRVYVTGTTAAAIDVSAKLSAALPLYVGIIVVLAVLLLMIAFRSLLVPLKAVAGFLLSIGASLGLVTWVFQDGHLGGAVQAAAAAPVIAFLPVLLIGVLFGLAMDYEVFLVSRMREHFSRHGQPRAAVVAGVTRSGRVVCAAALIMAAVFGSFVFDGDPIVKSIGFALTAGVLIDAFVVRMTLVPAVLALLGRYAWWLPRPLARVLPAVDIEGASLPAPAAGPEPAAGVPPAAVRQP